MAWTQLRFRRSDVDRAGNLLAMRPRPSSADLRHAFEVISNWRAAHAFPLNTFQVGLRRRARQVASSPLIAQRLKRLPTMIDKLRRMPRTKLSRFQDIGGCRAVVGTVQQVVALRDSYRRSRMKHQFVREKDYIAQPRDSGYRCIHLVYKFIGRGDDTYDGLQIEIQLRTRLQHAWATAVETVGTLLEQSLKSSEGSADWLRFFALVGSAFAFVEKTPAVPDTPTNPAVLYDQIHKLMFNLNVRERLDAYRHALKAIEREELRDADFYLLSLDPLGKRLRVTPFRAEAFEAAVKAYAEEEQKVTGTLGAQVVLVGSQSLAMLRRAYPNYFLDTELFVNQLERAMKRIERARKWPDDVHSRRVAGTEPRQGRLF